MRQIATFWIPHNESRTGNIISNDTTTSSRVPIVFVSQSDEAQHSFNPSQIVALLSTARKRSAACSAEVTEYQE